MKQEDAILKCQAIGSLKPVWINADMLYPAGLCPRCKMGIVITATTIGEKTLGVQHIHSKSARCDH